jgi:hypothetical protein
MFQHHAKMTCTLIAGMSGSGKTTFEARYLRSTIASWDFACRFIFDFKGDISDRMGFPLAETPEEIAAFADMGVVAYPSSAMFPGNREAGFDYFCRFALEHCTHMPGRKLIVVPEVWKHCNRNTIPQALAECVQDGRKHGIETMFDTQHPERVNGSILGEVTELVSFFLQEEKCLDFAESRGLDRAEIASLPLGAFVARNCLTRGEIRARLW